METKNCSNCRYMLPLHKHPLNKDFGKGSIMDKCGWVCLNPEITKGKFGVYFDVKRKGCEMHKLIAKTNNELMSGYPIITTTTGNISVKVETTSFSIVPSM